MVDNHDTVTNRKYKSHSEIDFLHRSNEIIDTYFKIFSSVDLNLVLAAT